MCEASSESRKPRPGDRVKLIGNHKYAGFMGIYLGDGEYINGDLRPKVKIETWGIVTFVPKPDEQMRRA